MDKGNSGGLKRASCPAELASLVKAISKARPDAGNETDGFRGGRRGMKERKAELGIKSDGKGAVVSNRAAGRGLGKNLGGKRRQGQWLHPQSVGLP